jgi:HK97 family phage major capsid protein/HK97 family phage prohead protease
MPLPTPHKNETEQDFVSRCIAAAVHDATVPNTDAGRAQGLAICYDVWRRRDEPKKPKKAAGDGTQVIDGDGNAAACMNPDCPLSDNADSADCPAADCPMHMGDMSNYMSGRAYSTIEIKTIDNEQRVIEGIASTPTPDRIGDVMNPLGAKFSLPMPLLWQHDSKAPIGQVVWAEARPDGIPFRAKIANVTEPGRLKDRCDEAWQSLKYGIVRGASIGFNAPFDKITRLKDGGFQYDEWSWLELSAVTIPANSEASITNIRSIDQQLLKAAASWSVGAARDLPINTTMAWDGAAAMDRMFNASPATAKRGSLAYDSANPSLKGSYKLPFADIINGRLTALASGLRAAASRLPQTDIPADVQKSARAVIDAYQARMQPKALPSQKVKPATAVASRSLKIERPAMAKMTNAERIKSLEEKRAAEVAAREAIQEAVADENRTKDEAEQNQFDEHSATIRAIDRELADCRMIEKELVAQARPVQPQGMELGANPVIQVSAPKLEPGRGLVMALGCELAAASFRRDVLAVARERYPQYPQVENYLRQKAAVAVGTVSSTTWAGPLVYVQNLASEFLEFLVPQTFFGKIPGITMVPFNSRVPRETSVITAQWVGEGRAKPAQAESFDSVTLTFAKMAAIMGVTAELARFSNPSVELLVRNNLAKGIAKFLDTQFITPSVTAVAGQNPASITNGADTHASVGTDIASVIHDIRTMLFHFQEYNIPTDNLVIVMQPALATAIGTMMTTLGVRQFPDINGQGGSILGIAVVTSNNSPTGQMTAIHPPSVFVADDGGITIDASTEASVEMADNPTSSDFRLVSAFQNNLIFVRAERYVTWVRGRDKGVYYTTGANYGGTVTG